MPDSLLYQFAEHIYTSDHFQAGQATGANIILTLQDHTIIAGEIFKPAGPNAPGQPNVLVWPPPGSDPELELRNAYLVPHNWNNEGCLVYRLPRQSPHPNTPVGVTQLDSDNRQRCGIQVNGRYRVQYGNTSITGYIARDYQEWLELLMGTPNEFWHGDPGAPFVFDYSKDPLGGPDAYVHLVDVVFKQPKQPPNADHATEGAYGFYGDYSVPFREINCCGDRQ